MEYNSALIEHSDPALNLYEIVCSKTQAESIFIKITWSAPFKRLGANVFKI